MRIRNPIIVAHRGYPAEHPENSIAAFDAAVEVGALWVEVDVQLRDGVAVLAHDAPEGDEETLAEFAAWLEGHPDVTALVDLKGESLSEYGVEPVVSAVMATMRGNWHPISFNYDALAFAVQAGSPAPGWVVCEFNQQIGKAAKALGVRWLITNQIFLKPGPVPEGPWEWMVYEIENAEQARDLMERGVRWLETMRVKSMGLTRCSGSKSEDIKWRSNL